MPRHDVAIYMPHSAGFYDAASLHAGGAERQMMLLATTLARRGVHVAHIVYPVRERVSGLDPHLTLVTRGRYSAKLPLVGRLVEGFHMVRALWEADGRVVVVRTGTPVVGFLGIFAKLRRRRFVFSSANDSDFLADKYRGQMLKRRTYRLGVRLADVVVVQTQHQLDIARTTFPRVRDYEVIPSFADIPELPPPAADRREFLWIGRLIEHKQPLRFVDLAAEEPEARFVMLPAVWKESAAPEREMHLRLLEAAERIPNLEVRERLPHPELMDLIAGSVAVVSTSRLEGMPNIFLEAWARGVPVLTLDFDPDGLVARRGLGIAADGSWERFADGARELWRQRNDREELTRRTRAYVEETHSPDAVAARWEELLARLGARRDAAP
ncbi:MAG TPA: glycosyltransferase family 4 protein [Gaiella sp.]|jgi:glycosyltransferase involved in cell wall biosynthesis